MDLSIIYKYRRPFCIFEKKYVYCFKFYVFTCFYSLNLKQTKMSENPSKQNKNTIFSSSNFRIVLFIHLVILIHSFLFIVSNLLISFHSFLLLLLYLLIPFLINPFYSFFYTYSFLFIHLILLIHSSNHSYSFF